MLINIECMCFLLLESLFSVVCRRGNDYMRVRGDQNVGFSLIINKTTNPNRGKSTTDHYTQTRLGKK